MIKKAYGGGPEIEFFKVNGELDTSPQHYEMSLELTEKTNVLNTFQIPYRLLLSKNMDLRAVLYHIATKLKVDVARLSFKIESENNDPTVITTENGEMTLNELSCFYKDPKYTVIYTGLVEDIGKYENEDVYTFFDLERPANSTNGNNSSTGAVDLDMGDGDLMYDMDDVLNTGFDNNRKSNSQMGDAIDNFMGDNQVPPEYANDPDLWYAIQSSLKESNAQHDADFGQPQEPEVALGGDSQMVYQDEYQNPNSAIGDIEMGGEEKKKTKTPSTGTYLFTHIFRFEHLF